VNSALESCCKTCRSPAEEPSSDSRSVSCSRSFLMRFASQAGGGARGSCGKGLRTRLGAAGVGSRAEPAAGGHLGIAGAGCGRSATTARLCARTFTVAARIHVRHKRAIRPRR
jgi:hypothetical protein